EGRSMFRTLTPFLLAVALTFGLGWAALPAAGPPPRRDFAPLRSGAAGGGRARADPPLPASGGGPAASLPRTTAGMLELDHLHRARNPLGAAWAGKLRWVAADEAGCAYARAYAEADLRRAGLTGEGLKALAGDWRTLPRAERAALTFA